jgi:hypothetical protein
MQLHPLSSLERWRVRFHNIGSKHPNPWSRESAKRIETRKRLTGMKAEPTTHEVLSKLDTVRGGALVFNVPCMEDVLLPSLQKFKHESACHPWKCECRIMVSRLQPGSWK